MFKQQNKKLPLFLIAKERQLKIFMKDNYQASQIKVPFISHLLNNPGLVESFNAIKAKVQEIGDYHDAYIHHQDGDYYEELSEGNLSEIETHNLENLLKA